MKRARQLEIYEKIVGEFYRFGGAKRCLRIAHDMGLHHVKRESHRRILDKQEKPKGKHHKATRVEEAMRYKTPLICPNKGIELIPVDIDGDIMSFKFVSSCGKLLFYELLTHEADGYYKNKTITKLFPRNCSTLPCGTFLCTKCVRVTKTQDARQNDGRPTICRTCYNKQRVEIRKSTPQRQIAYALRSRLSQEIRKVKTKKSARTMDLAGCDIEYLVEYLEDQFQDGMNWENHGRDGWHIDHIKPCASFDLTKIEQQKQCFHYTNLQPLWAYQNQSKGDKWDG
jgi:hypothetical protein